MKFQVVKDRFEANQDSENSAKMAAYMRNLFSFYGIDTKKRHTLTKDIIATDKKAKIIDWDFLDLCYAESHREFQYFAMDYLIAMQKLLTYDDIAKIKRYIKVKQWWDAIDSFDNIIGTIGLSDSRVDDLMLEWSTDSDFWLRRIAIDHQLQRKEKTNSELLGQIIVNCFGSDEFFINKAIGWSLREYSKTNPEWVREFILKHKDKMSKLSIAEGSKHLDLS